MYQLSLPGYAPTRPETVRDSLTAYFRNPVLWRDDVSFDFYATLKNLRGSDGKEITDPLNLQWYIHTLATADRMIDNAKASISVLSDNSADGLLSLLERNLKSGRGRFTRTNIRVISLNETNPQRFDEYNQIYGGISGVEMVTTQPGSPTTEINSLLICLDYSGFSSLEIGPPINQLPQTPPEKTYSVFYANGYAPKFKQEIFDMYWRKLNNIPETLREKSIFERGIDWLLLR